MVKLNLGFWGVLSPAGAFFVLGMCRMEKKTSVECDLGVVVRILFVLVEGGTLYHTSELKDFFYMRELKMPKLLLCRARCEPSYVGRALDRC